MTKSISFVIPAQAGIQSISNKLKALDSRFHGNDRKMIPVLIFFIVMLFSTQVTVVGAFDVYHYRDEGGVSYYTNAPGPGRTKVRLPLIVEKRYRVPSKSGNFNSQSESYGPIIASASRNYGVDPDVVRAVIRAESNYNEQAVSPKGALGLMQLMPATARELGVADAFDPGQNIHGGVRYLSQLLGALGGDLSLALAAYNAGPARVFGKSRIPSIPETRSYVEKVLKLYNNLQGRNTL